jgi:hypothetical protein
MMWTGFHGFRMGANSAWREAGKATPAPTPTTRRPRDDSPRRNAPLFPRLRGHGIIGTRNALPRDAMSSDAPQRLYAESCESSTDWLAGAGEPDNPKNPLSSSFYHVILRAQTTATGSNGQFVKHCFRNGSSRDPAEAQVLLPSGIRCGLLALILRIT